MTAQQGPSKAEKERIKAEKLARRQARELKAVEVVKARFDRYLSDYDFSRIGMDDDLVRMNRSVRPRSSWCYWKASQKTIMELEACIASKDRIIADLEDYVSELQICVYQITGKMR